VSISSEHLQVMIKEYEMLNAKVVIYMQRTFQVLFALGGGSLALVWYGFQKPEAVPGLALIATILLHAATISLVHSYNVTLGLKEAMKIIADRVKIGDGQPLLIWEDIWSEHWGSIQGTHFSQLTTMIIVLTSLAALTFYGVLVKSGFDFITAHGKEPWALALGWLYGAFVFVLLFLEIFGPIYLRKRSIEPYVKLRQRLGLTAIEATPRKLP
jgi:hypothetical protein